MKTYYVYILKCSDKTYYVGITSDIQKRIIEHNSGENKKAYTYNRRPLQLKYYCKFTNVLEAISAEKQIKKWSRIKKKALINNDYEKLPNLAKKKFI